MVALWWRYGGVMVALWWRYGGVMVALWWRPSSQPFCQIFSGRGGAYAGKSEIILGTRVHGRNF